MTTASNDMGNIFMPFIDASRLFSGVFAALILLPPNSVAEHNIGHIWRGLVVARENRCSPYERKDYRYSQSVEKRIVASMEGRIYGPYTGRHYASTGQTDIEHIVAFSEAHDSGLCAASPETRRKFSSDLINLTLAAPAVNRCGQNGKCHHDAAEWLPDMNRCWFAHRIVQIKLKYGLTVDRREAEAIESILSKCTSDEMMVTAYNPEAAKPKRKPPASSGNALALYDDNGNGRITCAEARRHGIAPVPKSHSAYRYMQDGDGDGVVCE
ncbi:MAG: excalibur calcium-binding domain-containing protein [Roseovarius sp.]|nr:excalibur calcium-binding domain-containing protein [Roseovarius sp.]